MREFRKLELNIAAVEKTCNVLTQEFKEIKTMISNNNDVTINDDFSFPVDNMMDFMDLDRKIEEDAAFKSKVVSY